MTYNHTKFDLKNLYYITQWKDDTDDDEIRRGSVLLRGLLGHDYRLGKIYEDLYGSRPGKDFTLSSWVLKRKFPLIEKTELACSIFSFSPGMIFGGLFFCRSLNAPPLNDIIEYKASMKIGKFRDSIGMIVHGNCVSRMKIIKYVSETKGAAHTGRYKDKHAKLYDRMDAIWETWQIGGRSPFLFAILGIANEITSSPAIQQMYKDAKKKFPDIPIPEKYNIKDIPSQI